MPSTPSLIDDGWATRSATELAAAIAARAISSRDLLELFVDRIERLDGPLNAVVTLDLDRARAAADAADAATARGDRLGPLHGLPVTIKDAIETEGIRSTGGAVALTDHVPVADAPVVASVKAAGAIVFGKTNVPEWSGDMQTHNEIFGVTSSAWDLERSPGGSSGGAATAVAAGFTSFEIGTDIGGSIRNPAHFNGVYGLKPSFGVVPQRGYLDHAAGGTTDADINVFGPLARSAADLELLLSIIAGPEPERALAWRLELPPTTVAAPFGARVAVWFDDDVCPIDSGYRARLGEVADALAADGAQVEAITPPTSSTALRDLFTSMIVPAMSPSQPPEIADAVSGSHHAWLRLERERAAARAEWARWFEAWDVLLCPVTPTAALPHDEQTPFLERTFSVDGEQRPFFENVTWPGMIGILGLPSCVPPIGRTAAGLPLGVQVVAPFLRDRTAIALAGMIAERCGGYEAPPGFGG